MFKSKRLLLYLLVLVIITSITSFLAAAIIFEGIDILRPRLNISFEPGTIDAQKIKKFNQVRSILKEEFYQEVDENTLIEGAIRGMANSMGDPYTVYFDREQMKIFMERSEGSYVGIGVLVTMDNNGLLTIVEPFEDSPAMKAGLKQGDKIIKVDDKDVTGIRDEEMIINMIKGEENTTVKITVYRPSEGISYEYEITRKRIKIVNINSEILPGNIGYIRIITFDAQISRYFEEHFKRLEIQGINALIIDLRDNPGGIYEEVVKIADKLLPKGVIVYTEDREKNKKEEFSDAKQIELPLAILINENSASASEILAGAVKDHKKGVLVGAKTFGKGLVQDVVPLEDGSGLKVTVARYFTPSGVCIQDIGIEPDVAVQMPGEYSNVPISQVPRGDDIQLQTALEMLRAKTQQ